jgi:hypothetical protein
MKQFFASLDATDVRDALLIAAFIATLAIGAALGSGA